MAEEELKKKKTLKQKLKEKTTINKKEKKYLKNFVKGCDLFGHQIKLNFNQKGDVQRTFIGGIFSIIVQLVMIAYIVKLLKRLVFTEEPSTDSVGELFKMEDVGIVSMNETSMIPFHVLKR